jgi:hypothetical protein
VTIANVYEELKKNLGDTCYDSVHNHLSSSSLSNHEIIKYNNYIINYHINVIIIYYNLLLCNDISYINML